VIERELRFLVERSRLLEACGADVLTQGQEILQGYLVADGTTAIRVRGRGHLAERDWTLTVKAPMTTLAQGEMEDVLEGSLRREVEIAVTASQAEELLGLCGDRIITKSRSLHLLGEHLWAEIDIFTGRWAGLVMVEVEFANVDQLRSFLPPDWFGRNVTSDPRFTNAGLATASASVERDLRLVIQAECDIGA
jgi:CYTH domain-containing protein